MGGWDKSMHDAVIATLLAQMNKTRTLHDPMVA